MTPDNALFNTMFPKKLRGQRSLAWIGKLIEYYSEKEGYEPIQLEEGVLGHGKLLLKAEGCKTCIIKEVYQNEWSSTHTVRFYNKCPKKYQNK